MSKSMKPLRTTVALASLSLGVGITWAFLSGIATGESSVFAYLVIPAIFVGVLPALIGFLVCVVLLRGGDQRSSIAWMTSPGALTHLWAETRAGFFLSGIVSAVIGILLSCALGVLSSSSYSGSAWRVVFFYVAWISMPALLGLGLCIVLMARGRKAKRRKDEWNRDVD